jgi:hypothetical protein
MMLGLELTTPIDKVAPGMKSHLDQTILLGRLAVHKYLSLDAGRFTVWTSKSVPDRLLVHRDVDDLVMDRSGHLLLKIVPDILIDLLLR